MYCTLRTRFALHNEYLKIYLGFKFSKTIFRCSWMDSTTMKWAISFPRVSLGFLTWVSCWTRLHWNEPSFLRKVSRGCPPPYNWHTRVSMLWDGSCNTARESNIQNIQKNCKSFILSHDAVLVLTFSLWRLLLISCLTLIFHQH